MRLGLVLGILVVASLSFGQQDVFVIDRFEDAAWVVLEGTSGADWVIPRSWVPVDANEGDVLRVVAMGEVGERHVVFIVDVEATQARRNHALRLREFLEPGPEGDLSL
jgi:hypothetical protein